jgi:hypothetical protein
MPYPCFIDSVGALDTRRLLNQVVNECFVIIRGKWPNHPASKIWANHKWAIADYALAGMRELKGRGAIRPEIARHWLSFYALSLGQHRHNKTLPPIMGYEPYHASHRSQLLAKAPRFYAGYGWKEEPGALGYVWTLPDSLPARDTTPDASRVATGSSI